MRGNSATTATTVRLAHPLTLVVVPLLLAIIVGSHPTPVAAQDADNQDPGTPDARDLAPGDLRPVRLARPTWDTGWFQAQVIAQLLVELGYTVEGPDTLDNPDFYRGIGAGSVDLWVNGWFPTHDNLLDLGRPTPGVPIGFEVRGGALQGYLADRATVDALGITTLADLADPDVAAAFDHTGDGIADLIGCNIGWGCGPIVDHHLSAYGLDRTVAHVRGDYGPLMRATVDRFEAGQPVLFYTFTPNWTVGELVPGRDVVWIPAPFPSLPDDQSELEPLTEVSGVTGCLADPCSMGFPPNDIRAVANQRLLDDEPAIAALLERFEIPLDDISDQNARMVAGEDTTDDIVDHAERWIAANRQTVDGWLTAAVEAHVAAGLTLSPRRSAELVVNDSIGSLRVATRLAPPFVTYDGERYGGFSVELLDLLAAELGADVEIYAVNSSAKLIDDVARGAADGGIGALAITADREASVDFSQPYIRSGLQILVADRQEGALSGRAGALFRAIFAWELLILVAILSLILVVAAHLMWFSERRHNPAFPKDYWAGIWESVWWAAVTATTVGYGDKLPTGRLGRMIALLWMFSGLFVLAYFTAAIATAFAFDELTGNIAGPDDLRGKAVGVPADSTAVAYLDRRGIAAVEFARAADAYDALLSGEVEAVVHDAAIVQHFVATDGRGGADITGPVFAERGFGLVFATGSDLTEQVNRALLEVIESGRYEALHDSWFGDDQTGDS